MSDSTQTPTEPKPSTSKTSKAASTKSAAKSGEMPPLINPAWAAAVVKQHDIMGKTAERAVAALTTAIEKQVAKATKPEKLEKLVLAAIAESYRDARK